jgi:hypothetical protein
MERVREIALEIARMVEKKNADYENLPESTSHLWDRDEWQEVLI